MLTLKTKQCTKCKETKSVIDFYKDSTKKTGLSSSCGECIKTLANEYALKHRKEKHDYDKARRDALGETLRAKKRKAYSAGGFITSQKWALKNPERRRATARNSSHRVRTINKEGCVNTAIFTEWRNTQARLCGYCGKSVGENFHVDHVEPLSKSGTHTLDNLVISCPKCNVSKRNYSVIYWMAKKAISRSLG